MEELEVLEPESINEIARVEEDSHGPSLMLSGVVAVLELLIHAFFAYHGRDYEPPQIAWACIFAPWLGASARKVYKAMQKKNA